MKIFVTRPVDCTKVGVVALLLAGIYYSAGTYLFHQWGNEDYNYCYLIPLICLYLVWEKRADLSRHPSVSTWKGLLLLLPGLLLFWLGELGGEYFTLYLSMWLVIVGLCWTHLGWAKLKTITFPLVILLTMFPPPNFLHTKISLQLKLISSKLGVAMIQAFGMSAFREGNVIDLGFTQLQVVDACSGLRYLFPLMVMGLLLAYFYRAAMWKKILLVVSTVPLTIITNSLRIAATGVLYRVWGPAVAEDFFHGFSGWLIFIFALGVLLLEMTILRGSWKARRLESWEARKESHAKTQRREELLATPVKSASHLTGQADTHRHTKTFSSADPAEQNLSQGVGTRHSSLVTRHRLVEPHFIVAVILLAGTLAVSQFVEFREKIPIAKPFNQFPVEVGEWSGRRTIMEQQFIDTLDLSDYTMIAFKSGGKHVDFYVAYYESQRKGESIHSPETCLPGSGWAFRQSGTTTIALAGHNPTGITVNRAFMEKGGQRQLSYFWFPQRGRVLTNAYQLKLFTFWDALTRQRTDGALVRLITPIYESEEAADAEKRLQAFTRDIVPVLNEHLPK